MLNVLAHSVLDHPLLTLSLCWHTHRATAARPLPTHYHPDMQQTQLAASRQQSLDVQVGEVLLIHSFPAAISLCCDWLLPPCFHTWLLPPFIPCLAAPAPCCEWLLPPFSMPGCYRPLLRLTASTLFSCLAAPVLCLHPGPKPYIHTHIWCTYDNLAGTLPYIQPYTVYINGSGQPYDHRLTSTFVAAAFACSVDNLLAPCAHHVYYPTLPIATHVCIHRALLLQWQCACTLRPSRPLPYSVYCRVGQNRICIHRM